MSRENEAILLARAVMRWWDEHKFDTTGDYGEYNVYDNEPEFVTLARDFIEGHR